MLNSTELFCVSFITLVALFQIIKGYRSSNKIAIWSPIVFVSVILIFYTVTGPLLAIENGQTYYKLTEHRPFYENSWLATVLSFSFLLFGYALSTKPLMNAAALVSIERDRFINYGRWGLRLYIIGFLLFLVYTGASIVNFINPLGTNTAEEIGYRGSFSNYFVLPVNFFVPALCLMLLGIMESRFSKTVFIVLLFIAVSIYLTFAFRYRLVMLGMALAVTYYSQTKKRPNVIFISVVIIVGILVMGVIQKTRTYFGGLDIEKIEDDTYSDIFTDGLGDAVTFGTLGLMIENIPNRVDYIYFSPYIQGFLIPIPRVIWPNKPAGEHLEDVFKMYGDSETGQGAAWPFYGEYYYSFGWVGIAVGSFIMGWFLKRIYIWFLVYRSPLVIVTYATILGCLFFIVTRGYFPQHVMLFFFAIYPCFYIIRKVKSSYPIKSIRTKKLSSTN